MFLKFIKNFGIQNVTIFIDISQVSTTVKLLKKPFKGFRNQSLKSIFAKMLD